MQKCLEFNQNGIPMIRNLDTVSFRSHSSSFVLMLLARLTGAWNSGLSGLPASQSRKATPGGQSICWRRNPKSSWKHL